MPYLLSPIAAGVVPHRHLRDPRAHAGAQRRDEPVLLGVERDPVQQVAAVGLEGAAVVGDLHAGQPADDAVGHPGRHLAQEELVLPALAPAAHQVVALLELVQQGGDVARDRSGDRRRAKRPPGRGRGRTPPSSPRSARRCGPGRCPGSWGPRPRRPPPAPRCRPGCRRPPGSPRRSPDRSRGPPGSTPPAERRSGTRCTAGRRPRGRAAFPSAAPWLLRAFPWAFPSGDWLQDIAQLGGLPAIRVPCAPLAPLSQVQVMGQLAHAAPGPT